MDVMLWPPDAAVPEAIARCLQIQDSCSPGQLVVRTYNPGGQGLR